MQIVDHLFTFNARVNKSKALGRGHESVSILYWPKANNSSIVCLSSRLVGRQLKHRERERESSIFTSFMCYIIATNRQQ